MDVRECPSVPADGTVYSSRKKLRPFSAPPAEAYASVVGEEKMARLHGVAQKLEGLKLLELNATARGGGVAEMLYSSIPFLDSLGIDVEWKTVSGSEEYFECTKSLHNLLQGSEGAFTPEMERTYFEALEGCARNDIIDYSPEVVVVHDPQPLGLTRYLKKPGETWLWRCHIDVEEEALRANPGLWDFISMWAEHYDAAIVTAAHYVISQWPLPKFIVPPFIDPLSEKNRQLSDDEIRSVLLKYDVDPGIPIIAQIGRFDPWKGLDRTIAVYRRVRKHSRCQLILAGGLASDDPEGARILAQVREDTRDDGNIHVLELSLADRLENYREVNALQRAAQVIMQPSTKEGFGLVITEALWKGKPVVAAGVGGIPLQIREGDTGYFYETPYRTAQKVSHLLRNPKACEAMGRRGHNYVREHFLLPDRIADCLTAIDMTVNAGSDGRIPPESIISFHPWFKLSKRPGRR